jgi:hypothetical protein
MTRAIARGLSLACLLACARAAAAPAAPETRPWAVGVSPQQQSDALQMFKEANALFAESQHAAALARYRESLKVWDHPAIRYNAAVALVNLDQPLAAYENLEASLKFGAAPLGVDTYKQALLYKKLLAAQLAELEVACDEPGAEVLLDGQRLFSAPGKQTRRLLPGAHQLVVRKEGYLTATRALELPAGRLSSESVKLQTIGSLPTHMVRRWAPWKPWTVFGAGLAVALIGVPLLVDAKHNYDTFDSEVARLCPAGCGPSDLPATVLDASDRARAENGAAIAMFAVGGALSASGVVMLILNMPHVEAIERSPLSLAPVLGPGVLGLRASLKY